MEGLDYWQLCDELTVKQAAFLTVGANPSGYDPYKVSQYSAKQPDGYEAAKAAISQALDRKEISGKVEALGPT